MERSMNMLGKLYGSGQWGLRSVSLTLTPGILGLLGPNGAGKTTLMRIVATITKPTVGTVTWKGVNIVRDPDATVFGISATFRRISGSNRFHCE